MMSDSQSPEAESFRSLRASFEFVNLEPGARSVLVTSAHPGEGKSSVAANLAIALSRAGRRVTLVDLDLRRPSLARQFRLSGGAGLTDVAVGSSTLEEALTTIGPKGGTLRVLTSGLVTRSGFLRRPALAELRRALFTCPAEKLGFVLTEASRDDWLANGGLS
jgi:Mrp family chromosome partitioning ATPase